MCTTIKTQNGYIHYWLETSFDQNKQKEHSKSEIEDHYVKEKLHQLYPGAFIEHEQNGAPLLKNADFPFVSVSHYQGWFALYISSVECGVDIQPFKNNMLKGKHYFVNTQEQSLNLSKINLHLIWAAKEAFYKKLKGRISDLKNDVSIIEIDKKSNDLTLIYKSNREKLYFSVKSKFIIVWT